jgi:hypothetical protein
LLGKLAKLRGHYEQATDYRVFTNLHCASICAGSTTRRDQVKDGCQKVVSIISHDKLKTQTYCQILELSDQIDQDENPANTDELAQKIDNLEGKLGPEFMTLVHDVSNMDPGSPDARDIHAIIESLDGLCGE